MVSVKLHINTSHAMLQSRCVCFAVILEKRPVHNICMNNSLKQHKGMRYSSEKSHIRHPSSKFSPHVQKSRLLAALISSKQQFSCPWKICAVEITRRLHRATEMVGNLRRSMITGTLSSGLSARIALFI